MNNLFRKIILEKTPLIDVRAPIEFSEGSIPRSVNLPILSDEERKEIGTLYKESGQERAVQRGYELVSGKVKEERVRSWLDYLENNPNAMLYCYRGGMRSQIAQKWILEAGSKVEIIPGGYKAIRRFLIQQISDRFSGAATDQKLLVISGTTGSGKTALLRELAQNHPVLDLEAYANHRGSSFGGNRIAQPTQINFEHGLATDLIRYESGNFKLLVEDESRMIGKCIQPENFYRRLCEAPILLIEESLDSRVEHIYHEYVIESTFGPKKMYAEFQVSLARVTKKLGLVRYQEVLADLVRAETHFEQTADHSLNRVWIEKMLKYYYDPIYLRSLEKKKARVIFRGTRQQVAEYIERNDSTI